MQNGYDMNAYYSPNNTSSETNPGAYSAPYAYGQPYYPNYNYAAPQYSGGGYPNYTPAQPAPQAPGYSYGQYNSMQNNMAAPQYNDYRSNRTNYPRNGYLQGNYYGMNPYGATPGAPTGQYKAPPSTYVCHKCGLQGHWIQYCDKKGKGKGSYGAPGNFLAPPPPPPAVKDAAIRCEACDKTFVKVSQLEAHRKTHITCQHEGCGFQASKSVVHSHFDTTHGLYSGNGFKDVTIEGQTFRVLVGDSKEDIEKWRQDRRKCWPSDENVQKKHEQMAIRENAGEIMDPNSSRTKSTNAAPKDPPKKKKVCKKFVRGDCNLGDKCHFNHNIQHLPCPRHFAETPCPFIEKCNYSHEHPKTKKRKKNPQPNQAKKQQKPNLLEKLLEKDLQHQRSYILQAFRYIVQNNFFQ